MRSVVITGAGGGIGAATTIRLDEAGWRVFACVHSADDGAVIDRQTSERVTVLPLDVTNADSIKDAAAAVDLALGDDGLHALIDNAGVAVAGPLATPIWSKAAKTLDSLPPSAVYDERLNTLREVLWRRGKESPSPQEGVDLIMHAVRADRPHTRYANGLTATMLPKVRRMIPDRLFDRLALRITDKADA